MFLGSILVMIILLLNLLLLAPFLSIFITIWSLISQVFRRSLDKIMMAIFTHLGRTPSRNTLVAKKISGPGMTKDFYMSINEEDVYVLMRSQLENIFMTKLNSLIAAHLSKEQSVLRNVMNKILKPFGCYYNRNDDIVHNVQVLQNNYSSQYSHYMRRYP